MRTMPRLRALCRCFFCGNAVADWIGDCLFRAGAACILNMPLRMHNMDTPSRTFPVPHSLTSLIKIAVFLPENKHCAKLSHGAFLSPANQAEPVSCRAGADKYLFSCVHAGRK